MDGTQFIFSASPKLSKEVLFFHSIQIIIIILITLIFNEKWADLSGIIIQSFRINIKLIINDCIMFGITSIIAGKMDEFLEKYPSTQVRQKDLGNIYIEVHRRLTKQEQ